MPSIQKIKKQIALEGERIQPVSANDVLTCLSEDQGRRALEQLIFFAPPGEFSRLLQSVLDGISIEFEQFEEQVKLSSLKFLTDLVLALRSALPIWNLQNNILHGDTILESSDLETHADQILALILKFADQAPHLTSSLLTQWREETTRRFLAEGVEDTERLSKDFVGDSISVYVRNLSAEIRRSNIRRIAEKQLNSDTLTEFSNDYAAFLKHAMFLGASFATTNPPLVDIAWQTFPEYWNCIIDKIIIDTPAASPPELAQLVTLEIVLANMRLLRPIFLLTNGEKGCVCLQVNPYNHNDADAMIHEAFFLYDELQTRLGGGVPNVVFKLPGVQASLDVCKMLVGRGIGVTITVNFGMFQHIPFTKAMSGGQAGYSTLVEMNGRLSFPVRDELLEKLEELSSYGIDETKAREAAAWAGVAIIKRVHSLLSDKGYDLRRFRPLVASLRIYEGEEQRYLPSTIPDITETMGTSIISVFPNVRRVFDQLPDVELDPKRIEDPVSSDILNVLAHSEIFRQAYFIDDCDWGSAKEELFKPDHVLRLDDEHGVITWPPVWNTLSEFQDSYDNFVQRILSRKVSITQGIA